MTSGQGGNRGCFAVPLPSIVGGFSVLIVHSSANEASTKTTVAAPHSSRPRRRLPGYKKPARNGIKAQAATIKAAARRIASGVSRLGIIIRSSIYNLRANLMRNSGFDFCAEDG